jgi:sulfite reductase (ferredoxin)
MDKPPSPAEQAKPSSAEQAKIDGRFLRGTIAEELSTEAVEFSKPATSVLKFHGVYQQDDRDLRKLGPKQISCMVRIGIPGGILRPDQYLALDRLADIGDESLRITTRQDIQYHYVPKARLHELISGVNQCNLNTLAACGDVVRNVVSCAAPFDDEKRRTLQPVVKFISRSFKPKSRAYYDIWVDGEPVPSSSETDTVEPLYGAAYLPRKFKIGFTFEGDNTTDVYANDIGVVPHFDGDRLTGYTILAGGGMGQSAGVKASHPRLASPICSIGPDNDELLAVCTAIVTIHRDFGNRSNRKLARLKYVLDAWGVARFKSEVEARVGRPLAPPRELIWKRANDYLGWHPQRRNEDGSTTWFVGVPVIAGRIKDHNPQEQWRAGLRAIVERFDCEVRFTPQQNFYLCGLSDAQKPEVAGLLKEYGFAQPEILPPVLRHAMSCPALPTCGQAITESERAMPGIVAEVQAELNEFGLPEQIVHLRTSGCPNGCARPYTAEIGIVGASVNMYTIYLGASPLGTRLGQEFARNVKGDEIAARLRPAIEAYSRLRFTGEEFGDFCHRVGIESLRESPALTTV